MNNYLKTKFEKIIYLLVKKNIKLLKETIFYNKKAKITYGLNISSNFEIFVIAFNNVQVLKILKTQLAKHLLDEYKLFIFDNSSSFEIRNEIMAFCITEKIPYVSIPKHPIEFKYSESHGIALNWVYKNYIIKRQPKYFGFIDHDIFPFNNINLLSILSSQNLYGLKHFSINNNNNNVLDYKNSKFWYLWPGFCFFKTEYIKKFKNINFLPLHYKGDYLDTGGRNYFSIYSKMNLNSNHVFAISKREFSNTNYHLDILNDSWIHTASGSNWRSLNLPNNFYKEISVKYFNKL